MLLLNVTQNNGTPVYRQIVEQIQELVNNGSIKPGYKLPSSRSLSGKLGINRSTVYKAYQELWALGYVESRPGSYSFIRKRNELADISEENTKSVIPWEKYSIQGSRNIYKVFTTLQSEASTPDNSQKQEVINLKSADNG